MARIRSIKPEFATDGSNLLLSDSCALFFILFWTQCDDEGKHRLDLNQVAAELGGRWHRGKVKLFMSCLIKSGQLRINSDSTWVQVTGWSHQKIDKPKQPQVKAHELQWVERDVSTTDLDWSREVDARIGSDRMDRIGSDHVPRGVPKPPRAPAEVVPIVPRPDTGANRRVWEAYRDSYLERYHVEPVRNANVNSKIAQFTGRLGAEEAIFVIKFFVAHNDTFYVKGLHAFGLALRDAESLRTQWATGKVMTSQEARSFEKRTMYQNQAERIERGEL